MRYSSSLLRRSLFVGLLGTLLAMAAPARAGVIGAFDPLFGPTIPNLGFRGTILLDVTPACYALGGGFHFTGGSCQITAQSAQINFYNATSGTGTLTTVNLTATTFGSGYVFGAYFDPVSGQLAGIDTNDSATFIVSVNDANPLAPIAYTGPMLLYFTSGTATPIEIDGLATTAAVSTPSIGGIGAAFLVDCRRAGSSCNRSSGTQSAPASLTFTAVPEPDGVALAAIGLAAVFFARRRARRASAARRLDA